MNDNPVFQVRILVATDKTMAMECFEGNPNELWKYNFQIWCNVADENHWSCLSSWVYNNIQQGLTHSLRIAPELLESAVTSNREDSKTKIENAELIEDQ